MFSHWHGSTGIFYRCPLHYQLGVRFSFSTFKPLLLVKKYYLCGNELQYEVKPWSRPERCPRICYLNNEKQWTVEDTMPHRLQAIANNGQFVSMRKHAFEVGLQLNVAALALTQKPSKPLTSYIKYLRFILNKNCHRHYWIGEDRWFGASDLKKPEFRQVCDWHPRIHGSGDVRGTLRRIRWRICFW